MNLSTSSPGGILLVGGAGRRMGGDKPWQPWQATTLYGSALETLAWVASPLLVVGVSLQQRPRFQQQSPPETIFLNDHGRGPLDGLHAGLEASPRPWNQLLPVDMPLLTGELLERLGRFGADLAIVPRCHQGRLHPLCGLYHRDCQESLRVSLGAGRLQVMGWLAELGKACRIVEARELEAPQSAFDNLNTREQLAAAARFLRKH